MLTHFLFDATIYVGISLQHIGLLPRLGEYCCVKGRETEKVMGVSLEEERHQMDAKPEVNTTAIKTAYDAVVDAFTTDLQLVKGLAKVTNIAPDAVRMHNKKDRPDHRTDLRYGLKDIGNYMTDVEMHLFIAWAIIYVPAETKEALRSLPIETAQAVRDSLYANFRRFIY